ncbi:hypothetical protein [Candidatus Avelusimicrobium stercoris]|uniref:hypothetical protein n=1 Tax=Candidatus Avelusimicrobium stercoris TaxID=1947924 RepID=UPI003D135ECA
MEYILGFGAMFIIFLGGYFICPIRYHRIYFWGLFLSFSLSFYAEIINKPYRLMRILSDCGLL